MEAASVTVYQTTQCDISGSHELQNFMFSSTVACVVDQVFPKFFGLCTPLS